MIKNIKYHDISQYRKRATTISMHKILISVKEHSMPDILLLRTLLAEKAKVGENKTRIIAISLSRLASNLVSKTKVGFQGNKAEQTA